MKFPFVLALALLSGCVVPQQHPDYTCEKSGDQRCSKPLVAWDCTQGVVPPDCTPANMGEMMNWNWIVCCPVDKDP